MKITIEHYGEVITKEMPDDITVAKFLKSIVALMVVVGYSPEITNKYFVDGRSPLEWETDDDYS